MSSKVKALVEEWSRSSDGALLALLKISEQANDEGRALISKRGLMRFMRKTTMRTVDRVLARLVELHELKISDGRANKWRGMEVKVNVNALDKRRREADAAKAAKAAAKRPTALPLPSDFAVTSAMAAWAEQHTPLVGAELATLDFVAWADSVEARFFDPLVSWQKFMHRRQEFLTKAAEHRAATSAQMNEQRRDARAAQTRKRKASPDTYVGTNTPSAAPVEDLSDLPDLLAQLGYWHRLAAMVAEVTPDSPALQPHQIRAFELLAMSEEERATLKIKV